MRSKTVHGVLIKSSFIYFMKGLNFEEYVIVVFVMSPFYEKQQYALFGNRCSAYICDNLLSCILLWIFVCVWCVCVCLCVVWNSSYLFCPKCIKKRRRLYAKMLHFLRHSTLVMKFDIRALQYNLLGELIFFKVKIQFYKNQDKGAGDILGYWCGQFECDCLLRYDIVLSVYIYRLL